MSKKFIKTTLEPGQFMPKLADQPSYDVEPYRNSNSDKEGLTIPRSALKKMGVPAEALETGTHLKMAVIVDGLEQMPLVQFHMNDRGGYVPGSILDYHESMGYLPKPRLKMGDRRRGVSYTIKVGHIQWFIENQVTVPVEAIDNASVETSSEDPSSNELSLKESNTDTEDHTYSYSKATDDETVQQESVAAVTVETPNEELGMEQSLVRVEITNEEQSEDAAE
jgi:hypothetical protein